MAAKNQNLLEVKDLKVHFPVYKGVFRRKTGKVHAVDGISLSIKKGLTLGLVGESGCGKTTLGRAIVRLYKPDHGQIIFMGQDIQKAPGTIIKKIRRNLQMIFQDPFESLNSRKTVENILEEPFIIHKQGDKDYRKTKVKELLEKVGMPSDSADRFPHEFSGGERQRIGIARAIALEPKMIICDEPVSALDVSVRAQIINLLLNLQKQMLLTCIFIAHDLSVVRHVSDYIGVMYLGKIVEYCEAASIYKNPLHPYTLALLSAAFDHRTKKRQILKGDPPSPINPPAGCRFHTRCPVKLKICSQKEPILKNVSDTYGKTHLTACHRAYMSK